MARVINIDTKNRTIRIENAADGDIKTWRTTESGAHFPIKKGESTKEALDKFVEKKRPGAKKEPGPDLHKEYEKARGELDRQEDLYRQGRTTDYQVTEARKKELELKGKIQKQAKQQPAKPSKKADVSDIIKSYKEKMAALGPKAPVKKTDRVEADAIKEFMTRKLGANRPYDDYYQYWLNGMDKKTREEFEEIYNESEAREMAFSELASDVDHSGLARGEPTYEELMQWAEKKKAEKAAKASQPAKEIGRPGDNIKHVGELLKTPKSKELYDRIGTYAKEHASELPLDHLEHLMALRKILLDDNNAAEHVEKNFQKWFGNK